MGKDSKIEWTDHTWNPWYGCPADGRRSPACEHCYARSWARRSGIVDFDREVKRASASTWSQAHDFQPGERVFVCSLSDFFHESVPDNWRRDAESVMLDRPGVRWIFVTKRPDLALAYLEVANCELGYMDLTLLATVENQEQADARVPYLLRCADYVTRVGVSCEPLLGTVDLTRWMTMMNYYLAICPQCGWVGSTQQAAGYGREECLCPDCFKDLDDLADEGLSWVICGGESGPGARPMHPDWARSLRDQCAAADVPFFFKQWGEWETWHEGPEIVVGGGGKWWQNKDELQQLHRTRMG